MGIVAAFRCLGTAAVVFFGRQGAVSELARQRDVSRQVLYREADAMLNCVEGSTTRQRFDELGQQVQQQEQHITELEQRLAEAVVIDKDKQAHFASRAEAEGVSLPVAQRLLTIFLGQRTPSVATLGRYSKEAGERSTKLLEVLDVPSGSCVQQAAADEIFAGRKPILMVIEQQSMCWVTGQLAEHRDGPTWAKEFRKLPALVQVTRDGGSGMQAGLDQVNDERRGKHLATVAGQVDHFHLRREGSRALRRLQSQAAHTLEQAVKDTKKLDELRRHCRNRGGQASVTVKRWRKAEAAMDRWSAQEQAWQQLCAALPLFSAAGALNTRERGTTVVEVVLPQLTGPEWAKVKRLLVQPDMFTYLDQVKAQLATLREAPELLQAALDSEGLRRRPELLQGDSKTAGASRGVLMLADVVLAKAKEAGQAALAAVRGVLRQAWRASSLVEGLNSVLRMHQARHRRLTQGLLDLKRLYWNCRAFRTGKRKHQTPYGRLGLILPNADWWCLLKIPPEQLRQQLSAQRVAA
jgi:hypothetical protein